RLTEAQLNRIVMEAATRLINEGIYGYPDGIDHIILLYENDSECMGIYDNIVRMLLKKAAKTQLDPQILANSSIMKKFQQYVFRKFRGEQRREGTFDPRTAPYEFRQYVANKMVNDINDGIYSQ
ncbi:MAG: hypothetical protein J6Y37_00120, partial [Paludibacteraceae bacterium]|nr:hypothetical protein [Paludibacteraceae bacterium]